MKARKMVVALALGSATALVTPTLAQGAQSDAREAMQTNQKIDKRTHLRDEMRKLWEDHVTWTRLYIVSAVANLPDKDATTKRLLRNQQDLGDAIKPYFGNEAGTKLTGLLKDHILLAAQLVDAAKAKDDVKVSAAKQKWYANADGIAAFLGKANPDSWPTSATRAMMYHHLDLTLEEATAQIQGRFQDSVAAYDKVVEQALMMADTLSSGITQRFPADFSERQSRR